jgi:hypothetical protein
MPLVPEPDTDPDDAAGLSDELEALRAFVVAHAQPDLRTGSREPIRYLPFRGGIMHHALDENRPVVDDALIEEMHAKGLISIDYRENSWAITPTSFGRDVIEEADRTHDVQLADVTPIIAALARQSEASNPFAWPAVRPVLEAVRVYWQASGYPTYGVALIPVAKAVPDETAPLFAATVQSLVSSGYLARGQLGGVILDEAGRKRDFPGEVAITEKAHTVLDGWPGAAPSELVENLLAVLASAAAEERDPARKKRLETLATAIKDVGVAVTSEVIAKVVTGGLS